MIRKFTEYAAIVEFLVKRQGLSVEAAMSSAEVPLHYVEQMRSFIEGPLEIRSPDILAQPQKIPLCIAPTDDADQPYAAAFQSFLLNERRWQRSTVETLGQASLDLICRLPSPSAGNFQTRGLVVGHVQSGKTANMAALIARAADQGYKLFIVLAGLMNDLRAQTQKRLDQEIAGGSDRPSSDGPFVEHAPEVARWVRLTRSGPSGDFQPGTHNDLNPQTPKLAVIKKNVRVLRRFIDWLRTSPVPLVELPAIVIDDEADQASIDTNYGKVDDAGEDLDPSKTNAAIRDLLEALPKCVYIGFTATPFANVLIDANVERDLFPRDFIATLAEPPSYFGPRQLFGLGLTPSSLSIEAPEAPPLDVIRDIEPDDLEQLENLRAGDDCPEILGEAVLAFVLSCCARLARGQDREHFTMLVHPSQRTDDHYVFSRAVMDEVTFLKEVVARPRSFPEVLDRARRLWEEDFAEVTRAARPDFQAQDFSLIWKYAKSVVSAIEIKVVNVRSEDDLLDYSEPPKRYIVIGGNRLSRGLTLEGLSVSFFMRSANHYDTLLQMGRWFGFRPGYHDLTRIWVEKSLAEAFSDLARVELELREDLKKYVRQPNPLTPSELAPKIRAHPSMEVTSRMKMGAGRSYGLSFQATTQNTVSFPTGSRDALRRNKDLARSFVSQLGVPLVTLPEGMHVWLDIKAVHVLGFLRTYTYGPRTQVVNAESLTAYIRRQNQGGELLRWDVVIPRGNPNLELFSWTEEIFSRKVVRSPLTETSIGVLQNPRDIEEWRRISARQESDPMYGCLLLYLIDKGSRTSKHAFFRSPADAEDILGFVLVFPRSGLPPMTDYVSQHLQ